METQYSHLSDCNYVEYIFLILDFIFKSSFSFMAEREKKKKKEFRYTEEDWKKSSPLSMSCLPQSDTAQCAK